MKNRILIMGVFLSVFASMVFGQNMTVKDSDTNVLMQVEDKGTTGALSVSAVSTDSVEINSMGAAPDKTANKLYNISGSLYWSGTALGVSGSAGGWTDGGANVYTTTSTDKVGIGTSSPGAMLSLQNSVSTDWNHMLTILAPSAGNDIHTAGIMFGKAASANQSAVMHFVPSASEGSERISFGIYAANDLVNILGHGEVGIGTTSPNNKLDVNGTAEMTGFKLTTSPSSGYVLTSDASGNGTWQAASGGGDFSDGGEAGGADRTLGNTDNYDLGFLTNNQTRLHIQNDGKVGIGTSSPGYKLDVRGDISTGVDGSGGSLRLVARDAIDDGGRIFWSGAGSFDDWVHDVFYHRMRIFTNSANDNQVEIYNAGTGIATLDVERRITASDVQVLYLPLQTDFAGSLIIGNGGGSLSHGGGSQGQSNTAVGIGALNAINIGWNNVAIGHEALYLNTGGSNNSAIGYQTLHDNTTGAFNTAVGDGAGHYNTEGHYNTVLGYRANYKNQEGSNNTIIGYEAGSGSSTHNKSGNVFIGYQAGKDETGDNRLYIANSSDPTPLIGGDFSSDEVEINGDLIIRSQTGENPGIQLYEGTTAKWIITDHVLLDGLLLQNSLGGAGMFISRWGGKVGLGGITDPETILDVNGNITVRDGSTIVLELGSGLDYAEGFNVSDNNDIQPGTVLCIDPENPGELTISQQSYDRKVAGIVAGAGNLGSGVTLGSGTHDLNVALAGRVNCKVDATRESVRAGDLLTTSDLPGYARKVTDYEKARGSVLGKAMENMEKGQKGLIMVLVTLQ